METAIVFGKVGSGKSTLCNMLCYREPSPLGGFPTSDGFRGMTSTVDIRSGNGWTAVDTIGMGETKQGTVPTDEAKKRLKAFLKNTSKEYTYIMYVIRKGRFSEEEQVFWEVFKKIFKGGEDNFVIVYTHASKHWVEKQRAEMDQAFDQRKRIIGVDFPPTEEDEDDNRNEDLRKNNLKRLEDTLRGYTFRNVKPDTFGMSENQLCERVEMIYNEIKAFITARFPYEVAFLLAKAFSFGWLL